MKNIFILALCLMSSLVFAQQKKTSSSKPKLTVQEKAAILAKAKQDSTDAVNALARQLARKMFTEDSLKKVQLVQQQKEQATPKKTLQEQYDEMYNTPKVSTDKNKKNASKTSVKKEKEVAKTEVKEVKTSKKNQNTARTVVAKPEKIKKEKIAKTPKVKVPKETNATEATSWLGVRGVALGTTFVGNDIPKDYLSYSLGYAGGLVANFGLSEHLLLQPEILYQKEAIGFDVPVLGKSIQKTNAIHVPLLLKYSFGANNQGFFINAGPYGSYLLSTQTDNEPSVKPDKTSIEYGIAGGFGIALPAGNGRLLIELRGTYSLGNTESNTDKINTVTAGASIGYLFPL